MQDRLSSNIRILAIVCVLAAGGLRILMIDVPFERDEGGYAYIADQWMKGHWPYVHAVESKPPGVFALYAVALAIDRSVASVRWFMVLVGLMGAALFFFLVRQYFDERIAYLAAAVLALAQPSPSYFGHSANAEMFMVPCILAAFLAVASNRSAGRIGLDFLGGVLIGCAVMIKPVALTEGLPLLTLVILEKGDIRLKIRRLLVIGTGFLVLVGATFLLFSYAGAGREFLFWSFGYNVSYSSGIGLLNRWFIFSKIISAFGMLTRDWPLLVGAMIGFAVVWKNQSRGRIQAFFPTVWALSSFIGISASGYYYPHYFQQGLPPLALFAAVGASHLVNRLGSINVNVRPLFRRTISWIVLGLLLAWPTLYQAHLYLSGPGLARKLYGLSPFMEGEMIGRYLTDHTSPDEKILVFGSEGQFLFHANRQSAWKYVFAYPLAGFHKDTLELQKSAFQEVLASRPRYILLVWSDATLVLNNKTPLYIFGRIQHLLDDQYQPEAVLVPVTAKTTKLITEDVSDWQGAKILTIYRRN